MNLALAIKLRHSLGPSMIPCKTSKEMVRGLPQSPHAALFAVVTLLLLISGSALHLAAAPPSPTPAAPSNAASLGLTPQQVAWLQQHPQIRVGLDPAWPPFSSYSEQCELTGIDADMLNLLQQRLGITFVMISGKSWSEVYGMAKNGQVDMLAGVAETPERLALLNFTESYIEFPVGLITRDDAPFMIGLPYLQGHVVATPRDYAPSFFLQHDYPNLRLVYTENVTDALQLVSKGRAFATLDNLASANYIIKDRGFSNLKVAGITDYQFALRYGVRKDWPELIPILHQALQSISGRERETIKDKWINLNIDDVIASRSHERILFICLGVVAVLILLVLIWNRTLAREIWLRKHAEIELRDARKRADDASQMKSDFLANLSHEMRNPLQALLGYTELLKAEAIDRKFHKYVESIDVGGRTLLGVINDVLDLSKVEAGRLEIHLTPVDFRDVFRETHALFVQRAAQKGINLTCELAPALPSLIMFDELRLRQILSNCLSNAIKFTQQGSVCLRASFTPGPATSVINVLTFEVSDTGPGIPVGEQARIFEPFAQREGQAPNLGGTGLGLSISKRLTELMGGRIELESAPGKGTTFRFIFPRVDATPPPPA